jgi:hypothetical protein
MATYHSFIRWSGRIILSLSGIFCAAVFLGAIIDNGLHLKLGFHWSDAGGGRAWTYYYPNYIFVLPPLFCVASNW